MSRLMDIRGQRRLAKYSKENKQGKEVRRDVSFLSLSLPLSDTTVAMVLGPWLGSRPRLGLEVVGLLAPLVVVI